MPFISEKKLVWLFSRSYYPTFTSGSHCGKKTHGYHFGTLPGRRTISQAIADAMISEEYEKRRAQQDLLDCLQNH